MSNVTSQSELTTKEIVEQAISDYHNTILPYLAKGNNGYSETPIGAMQMFDDDTAPSGWLVADGTVYDIDDYPFLANHIERVHGSKNYYGGNGTTTFAVPNWQGEFFRASGTNSHTNQGSGAAVGEHQDGTIIPNIFNTTNDRNVITFSCEDSGIIDFKNGNPDVINLRRNYVEMRGTYSAIGQPWYQDITTRPTNTSLLCCIKAVPAGINYSTEEQEIGIWVDGKTIYQKTVKLPDQSTNNARIEYAHSINNIDTVIGTVEGSANYMRGGVTPISFSIPFLEINGGDANNSGKATFSASATNIIFTSYNFSFVFTDIYATIHYTKTTD